MARDQRSVTDYPDELKGEDYSRRRPGRRRKSEAKATHSRARACGLKSAITPRNAARRMAWLPSTLVSDNGCLKARAACGKLVLVAGEARLSR